jgi:hypothetical protein
MNQKILGIVTGICIALVVLGGLAFVNAQMSADRTSKYIDEDNNGVCDYAQSGNCPYQNQSGGFTDANGDGICDNMANCPMHQNKGGCHGSEGCPYRTAGRMNCHS